MSNLFSIVLSETPYADFYPFLGFFTRPLHNDGRLTEIGNRIETWVKAKTNTGLILVGPDCKERNHMFYLLSYMADLRLTTAKDIVQKAMQKEEGESQWDMVVGQYSSNPRHAINFLGEETKMRGSPISDIVHRMWNRGEGIVAGTALGKADFRGHYGEDTYSMMEMSCEIIKWPE